MPGMMSGTGRHGPVAIIGRVFPAPLS